MFVSIRRPNNILKNASSRIDLTTGDIIKFREHRFEKSTIDNYAELIKQRRKEWEEFENEYVVALFLKEQHFNNISKGIKSLTTVASVGILASLLAPGDDKNKKKKKSDSEGFNFNAVFQNLINGLSNNSEEISAIIVQYIGPDFSIEQGDSVIQYEHKKVVVSEYQGKPIASILKDLCVPESISSEMDDIWKNGLTISSATSIVANSISYFSEKQKEVNTSNFGRKRKIIQEEESSDDSEYYDSSSDDDSESD
jgi:hypothetical protein